MNNGLLGWPRARLANGPLGWPVGLGYAGEQRIASTAVPATSVATTVTAGASANQKGAWSELTPGLEVNADGFLLQVNGAANVGRSHLVDVGIGPAGSEVVILSNILYSVGSIGLTATMFVPLPIPARTRVAARSQATTGSTTSRVQVTLIQNEYARAMRMKRATTYGALVASSIGTNVDPGGVANTKGAYTELARAVEETIRYVIIGVGTGTNTVFGAGHNQLVDLAFGPPGNEQVVVNDLCIDANTAVDHYGPLCFSLPVHVPSGERLCARSQDDQTDATDRIWDCVVIGFS